MKSACAFVLFFCLAACSGSEAPEKNDLALAEKALASRDIGDAEMHFEHFLRKNPESPERWQVWQRLLEIALNIRQEKATARAYLEIMLKEFAAESERRRGIEMSLAALCREMGDYTRAVALWEGLAQRKDLPPEDRATVYRELAGAYRRRLEFTPAADALQACLELQVSDVTKASCLYDLGETQMLTEELPKAEMSLRSLLRMQNLDAKRRALASFMLADVLEQQDKNEEALKLFESIQGSYPNEKVIEKRILFLKNRKK